MPTWIDMNMHRNSVAGSIWQYIYNNLNEFDQPLAIKIATSTANIIDSIEFTKLHLVEEFMRIHNISMINFHFEE